VSDLNPNPSHLEGFATPASFNRALVNSDAARKDRPPAWNQSLGHITYKETIRIKRDQLCCKL